MDIKNIKKEWNAAILDILKTFISICHTHNLRYYCCAGTAIGAVRHHGMIPWDDDIDVIMPRPDYDRFLEIARHEDFGNYEVVTPYNNERYPLYFSKLVNKNTTLIEEKSALASSDSSSTSSHLMPLPTMWNRPRLCSANM